MATFTPVLHHFDELASTNTTCAAMAATGAPAGTTVTTDHQTTGRGRLDRRWEAPPGSGLLCSVLLRPRCAPTELHLATIAMALAAAEAIERVAGMRPALKWPNDLLLGGAKCAGILAEAQPGNGDALAVVVGIGVNCTYDGPAGVGATSLATSTGVAVQPGELAAALLDALGRTAPLLDDSAGRSSLVERYRTVLDTIGREVRVERASGDVVGTAVGVDEVGALLVESEGSVSAYAVGDVVHLRAVEREG